MSVFVATCTVCARGKSLRQPAAGLLHPLPIPNHPWSQVALDSISSLPPSEGFTANLVVGDRFSKAAHFPSPNYHHRRAGGATCCCTDVLYPRPSPGHCVGSRSSLCSGRRLPPASAPLSACRLANPNPNQALEGIQRCYASKNLASWSQCLLEITQYMVSSATSLPPFQCQYGYQSPLFPEMEKDTEVPSVGAQVNCCQCT